MRNPLRGIFKPTPEDNAALDVVREAMEDVRPFGDRSIYGFNGGWYVCGNRGFFYHEDWNGNDFPCNVEIIDAAGLPTWLDTPVLELRGIRIPLSLSARRELRRMVKEFRVTLAMKATEYQEEV